jgi:hypothetical protein
VTLGARHSLEAFEPVLYGVWRGFMLVFRHSIGVYVSFRDLNAARSQSSCTQVVQLCS